MMILDSGLLLKPPCMRGHSYYSSIPLFFELLKVDTGACGTIRANRRGYSQQLVKKAESS